MLNYTVGKIFQELMQVLTPNIKKAEWQNEVFGTL